MDEPTDDEMVFVEVTEGEMKGLAVARRMRLELSLTTPALWLGLLMLVSGMVLLGGFESLRWPLHNVSAGVMNIACLVAASIGAIMALIEWRGFRKRFIETVSVSRS